MITVPARVIVHAPHLAKLAPVREAAPLPARTVRVSRRLAMPATWEELHLWGLAPEQPEDPVWLMDYGGRVPGNCDCRKHWLVVLDQFPPRFGDKFAWSVDVHNAVRRHLKQPELTLEAACVFWTARRDELNRQLNPPVS